MNLPWEIQLIELVHCPRHLLGETLFLRGEGPHDPTIKTSGENTVILFIYIISEHYYVRVSIQLRYTAISKKVGEGFVASCIMHTKPKIYCGSYVNNVGMHIQKKICRLHIVKTKFGKNPRVQFWAWDARCNETFTNLFWNSCILLFT